MPLQIRRGTDAERLAMTQPLAQGELLFVSTPGAERLYIGNGSTLGGIQITGYTNADAKDAAAASFTGGTHSGITFTYNTVTDLISANVDLSNYQGSLRADAFKGSVFAEDSSLLVDAVAGVIPAAVVSGTFTGDVIGNVTGYHTGDVKGSVFADDSTILVDAVAGIIPAAVVSGTFSGNIIGNVTGDVTGDVTGYHTGDVKGSVFGDDSSVIVNSIDRVVTAAGGFIGNVTGNADTATTANTSIALDITNTNGLTTVYYPTFVENRTTSQTVRADVDLSYRTDTNTLTVPNIAGNLTGSVTGNIFTNLIDSADSSAITVTPATIFSSDVTVDNELFANLTGNVIGNVTGNVTGSILDSNGLAIIDVSNTTFNGSGINFNTATSTITSPGAIFTDVPFFVFTAAEPAGTLAPVSLLIANTSGAQTAPFGLTRSRGSIITPATVINNDEIGKLASIGFDGVSFISSSTITTVVDGAVSSGVVPSRIEVSTTNSSGTSAIRVNIKSSVVEFAVPPKLPVVADDTARTALVPTPSTGMMIFMTAGTTPAATNKVQVYDSAAWVNLH